MKWIQYLIFEISNDCNMADKHSPICPIRDQQRYANQQHEVPMTDAGIVAVIILMYTRYGFKGNVGFHYYCEPTLEWDRMQKIIDEAQALAPQARFGLMTNGTRLWMLRDRGLNKFTQVKVTDYLKKDWSWLDQYCSDVEVVPEWFDRRADPGADIHNGPCGRIFNEIIFDYYGNAHPCCMDWRGEIKLGNYSQNKLVDIIQKFQELRKLIYPMSDKAPKKCRECFGRFNGRIANIVHGVGDVIAREVEESIGKV